MRKVVKFSVGLLLMFLISFYTVSAAEEEEPFLDKATIEITIEDDLYTVKQDIVLSNLNGDSVVHNTKEITENKITNVTFTSDEGELIPEIEEGETLNKYIITPTSNGNEKTSYTIEYNVEKNEGVFEVPLFVPEYATYSDDRVIEITFQAPEGSKIQKNSFPNVNKSNQTYVEKKMSNIPAIAKYVYSENPTSIHLFSVVSFLAIFSLVVLLIGWAIVEKKRGGNK